MRSNALLGAGSLITLIEAVMSSQLELSSLLGSLKVSVLNAVYVVLLAVCAVLDFLGAVLEAGRLSSLNNNSQLVEVTTDSIGVRSLAGLSEVLGHGVQTADGAAELLYIVVTAASSSSGGVCNGSMNSNVDLLALGVSIGQLCILELAAATITLIVCIVTVLQATDTGGRNSSMEVGDRSEVGMSSESLGVNDLFAVCIQNARKSSKTRTKPRFWMT